MQTVSELNLWVKTIQVHSTGTSMGHECTKKTQYKEGPMENSPCAGKVKGKKMSQMFLEKQAKEEEGLQSEKSYRRRLYPVKSRKKTPWHLTYRQEMDPEGQAKVLGGSCVKQKKNGDRSLRASESGPLSESGNSTSSLARTSCLKFATWLPRRENVHSAQSQSCNIGLCLTTCPSNPSS